MGFRLPGSCCPSCRDCQQQGGAIVNYGGELTFRAGSSFHDNTAASTGDGGSGGAIYNDDGGVMT